MGIAFAVATRVGIPAVAKQTGVLAGSQAISLVVNTVPVVAITARTVFRKTAKWYRYQNWRDKQEELEWDREVAYLIAKEDERDAEADRRRQLEREKQQKHKKQASPSKSGRKKSTPVQSQ